MIEILNLCITTNLLIIAVILFVKKTGNVQANRMLAVVLLSNVILNYLNVLVLKRHDSYKYFVYWEYIAAFSAGPTIYFYVLINIGRKVGFNFKTAAQYGFMLLCLALYFIYLFKSPSEKQLFLARVFTYESIEFMVLDILFYLQFTTYLVVCLVVIYKNNQRKKGFYSSSEKIQLNWLFTLVLTLLIMDLAALPIATIGFNTLGQFVPILSSLIYLVIVYKAFTRPSVFSEFTDFKEVVDCSEASDNQLPVADKNVNAGMLIQQLDLFIAAEKPYLNKELTIKTLADAINIPSYQLSQVINQHYQKNFFDFINCYRVEEAKLKLRDMEQSSLTIEGIGSECGFGSPSAFYRAFKKNTGFTPSQFIKQTLVALS